MTLSAVRSSHKPPLPRIPRVLKLLVYVHLLYVLPFYRYSGQNEVLAMHGRLDIDVDVDRLHGGHAF